MTVQERIFKRLRQRRELTRQEISAGLALSMPTTLQNVTELALEKFGNHVLSLDNRKEQK